MRSHFRRLTLLIVFTLFSSCIAAHAAGYWPAEVSEDQIRSVEWRFDPADLRVEGMGDLTVLSVSPSGQYIAAADRSRHSPEHRNAADVANPLGRLPEAVCLFSRQDGHYRLDKTIPVDAETQLELSSLLGGGSEFAWSEDETRAVITGDWGPNSTSFISIHFHSNLYLLEIADGSFRQLTRNSQANEHCVMPRWSGNDLVRYVRSSCENDWQNALCEMDVETGEEKKLADLYNAEGRACPVLCWQIADQRVYYTVDVVSFHSGFYASPLGGTEADARCLIDISSELVETNRHPYCRFLYPLEISPDGKWACIGALNLRVMTRDIPLTDDETFPQGDPANAVSIRNGRPWVPCHNVFLYDLEAERLVDPFVDGALAPTNVIVTAACFAPDGQSLLCAVFGDDGPWKTNDCTRATFYQISLADGDFTAVRVFETELESSLWLPKGIRWQANNVLCIPTDVAPLYPVQMMRPAVFRQYP